MAKFQVNRDLSRNTHTVEAEQYSTNGAFIDFVKYNEKDGMQDIVFRIKADLVSTIHREEAATE